MRRPLSWIVVVAFALRSLLPAGFMLVPSVAGAGDAAIVICTASGPQVVALGDAAPVPAPAPSKPTKHAAKSCPFAFAKIAILGENEGLLGPAILGDAGYEPTEERALPDRRLASFFARGPPASSV